MDSLEELYRCFDALYEEILPICKICTDHDCEGYTWLLPDEVVNLETSEAQIVEINGICNFINPFENILVSNFEKMKPKCPLLKNGLCSIYHQRPLVCRMYPVGLTTIDEEIFFVLFNDCKYSRMMSFKTKGVFVEKIFGIFGNCSPELYDTIIETYSTVDSLFKYPEGKNEYEVLANCRDLKVANLTAV